MPFWSRMVTSTKMNMLSTRQGAFDFRGLKLCVKILMFIICFITSLMNQTVLVLPAPDLFLI